MNSENYKIEYNGQIVNGKMYTFIDNTPLPYMLFIPDELCENTNMIVGCITDKASEEESYETTIKKFIESRKNYIEDNIKKMCVENHCPILFPIVPRFKGFYGPFLSSKVRNNDFNDLTSKIKDGYNSLDCKDIDKLKNIDEQVFQMIMKSKKTIKEQYNIDVADKVIMSGYSAAGHFASAFSILHPEIVCMEIIGGIDGIISLPLKELEGKTLNFPLGVNDIPNFDINEYLQIAHYIYMGKEDTNDCAELRKKDGQLIAAHSDCYTDEEALTINTIYAGLTTQERLIKNQQILNALGIDNVVEFFDGDHKKSFLNNTQEIAENSYNYGKSLGIYKGDSLIK